MCDCPSDGDFKSICAKCYKEYCFDCDIDKTFDCDECSTFYCLDCTQCHEINEGWHVCDKCFRPKKKKNIAYLPKMIAVKSEHKN